MLIHEFVEKSVHAHPDRTAIEDGAGEERTFAMLWERAQRLAAGLLATGLQPGDRVLEALPNGCALIESDLAMAVAGLVRVPLNPRLGQREWAAIATDSGARGLIVGDGLSTADHAAIEEHVTVDQVIRVGRARGGEHPVEELIGASDPLDPVPTDADSLVGLAYSSGTTGLPKGARRTHRMRTASARAMLHSVLAEADAASLYLHAGPAIHTSGLFVLPMLELGARQLLMDHLRPADIVRVVHERSVTHLALVPTVIAAMSDLPDVTPRMWETVQMLAYAGSPMPVQQLRCAAERLTSRLVQYYGLVEAMPPLTVLSIEDHRRALTGDTDLARSAGRILEHVDLTVERPDEGGVGEVVVAGDVVTPGYWNAENRDDLGKTVTDGRLATGDVGRIVDGYLWLTDRRNDMIISGGYNIYPREIEEVVAAVPGVRQCAAIGVPDDLWGQRLEIVVAAAVPTDIGEAVMRACSTLAPHKRPKRVHVRGELPLGATGKIDRRAVTEEVRAG